MRARGWWLDAGTVAALAVLARVGYLFASRIGPLGNEDYDASVYYGAADALIHGRLPYRDYVLLHPPGSTLTLTPFALLGRLTTDRTGFVVACIVFVLLGAASAALVVRTAHALGLSRRAALVGGAFYAVWFGAVGAEVSPRLEPLGSVALLGALTLLAGRRTSRGLVAAGALLGFAVTVKIWYVVPLLVVLVWLGRGSRRDLARVTTGAVGAIVCVCGPFFVAAPSAMWRMVVTDQLGRSAVTASREFRLDELSTLHGALPGLHSAGQISALVAVGLLGVALGVLAWSHKPARVIVVLAAAQLVVLLVAPSYFVYYSGYLAPALALLVAAAATRRVVLPALATLAALAATGAVVFRMPFTTTDPFPRADLAAGLTHVRCLMTDSPMVLVELDRLSSELARGCPNSIDVSGEFYEVPAQAPGPDDRRHNAGYQRYLLRYLQSGDALLVVRPETGLDAATRQALAGHAVLVQAGGFVVRWVH